MSWKGVCLCWQWELFFLNLCFGIVRVHTSSSNLPVDIGAGGRVLLRPTRAVETADGAAALSEEGGNDTPVVGRILAERAVGGACKGSIFG